MAEPVKNIMLNIRGTSGSGKSTLVRMAMEHFGAEDLKDGRGRLVGHICPSVNLRIVGRYDRPCGGCDSIKSQDEVLVQAGRYARQGNVIFEGLLVSGISSRYIEFARSYRHSARTLFAFLDTPVETCLSRVSQRRSDRGAEPEFNFEHTVSRWNSLHRVRAKLRAAGQEVIELDHTNPLPQVVALFDQ
jgi:thymidylate kinase